MSNIMAKNGYSKNPHNTTIMNSVKQIIQHLTNENMEKQCIKFNYEINQACSATTHDICADYNVTYRDAIQLVYNKIGSESNLIKKSEMKNMLYEELKNATELCLTGKINKIICLVTGFYRYDIDVEDSGSSDDRDSKWI